MSDLLEAIDAEARGDFAKALTHYSKLTSSGSAMDRIGIYQALARCAEKLGRRLVRTLDRRNIEDVAERSARVGEVRAHPVVVVPQPWARRIRGRGHRSHHAIVRPPSTTIV